MKLTTQQWLKEIPTAKHNEGERHWCTATCPLCPHVEEAPVESADAFAAMAAQGKVLVHMLKAHPESIEISSAPF